MEVVINAEPKEKEDEKEYCEWEIEDAYRTLKKAEEIKQDPELMSLVAEYYKKDQKAIKSLAGLKNLASKKAAEEADDMED